MNTEEQIEVVSEELEIKPKKSKGQMFKEFHGFSKTMKRNMQKNGLTNPAEYRALRKQNKKSGKFKTPKRPKPKVESSKPTKK